MIRIMFAALLLGLIAVPASAREMLKATLYRNPNCSCCLDYAAYLRRSGFDVTVDSTHDLAAVRRGLHVSKKFAGCHVSVIGGYAIEGHVSADAIHKLINAHPAIIGISLPGMPQGAPGMTGQKAGPLDVYEIGSEANPKTVFAVQ